MTSNKHNFEELATPSVAAKKLGISVATLRKYSLIVEKVTGNSDYYERTKQKARLYRKQDISDLDAFQQLSKKSNLTLQEAARQIYAVSDKKTEDKKRAKKEKSQTIATDLMDTQEVVKLLNTLQQTIANQNQAIDSLQKQLTRVEKQNQELLEKQNELAAPADPQEKLALAAPEEKNVEIPQTREEEREIENEDEDEDQVHDEILTKAKENAKKRATANVHRTLEDMQISMKRKKHWWQRFLNS
ncbi:MAG: transcriptional regulator [Lactobacillus sp.]|nr:transcriptional regulator [Lactobacillus sp.]